MPELLLLSLLSSLLLLFFREIGPPPVNENLLKEDVPAPDLEVPIPKPIEDCEDAVIGVCVFPEDPTLPPLLLLLLPPSLFWPNLADQIPKDGCGAGCCDACDANGREAGEPILDVAKDAEVGIDENTDDDGSVEPGVRATVVVVVAPVAFVVAVGVVQLPKMESSLLCLVVPPKLKPEDEGADATDSDVADKKDELPGDGCV